ncbi:MAG: divalent-cation tolerance protein CutA [Bauldia sp.]|nr:divalent-cation tolerance protein CutA [Bauldia sp.]
MDDENEPVAIYVTFPDMATAEAIGGAVVEEGLAACINILPQMRSIYRWKGAISRDDEVVGIMKTRRARVEAIVAAIEARHPYETPAIVVLPIVGGSRGYLDWIVAETSG